MYIKTEKSLFVVNYGQKPIISFEIKKEKHIRVKTFVKKIKERHEEM